MKTKTKNNGYKIAFWTILIVILAVLSYGFFNALMMSQEWKGYTQASIDEANYTSQTGVIYYLMNTSNYTSRNSTTISQIQYEAIASCVKSSVCTWNQTKYEELNRK